VVSAIIIQIKSTAKIAIEFMKINRSKIYIISIRAEYNQIYLNNSVGEAKPLNVES
jgi:hypothetical protein